MRRTQQRSPLLQQQTPRRREARAMAGTVEQQRIELGLDLLHGVVREDGARPSSSAARANEPLRSMASRMDSASRVSGMFEPFE